MMSLKAIPFTIACVIAWFILLPLLVIGGGIALFAYATFAELGAVLTGSPARTLDTAAAREIARRMCGGHLVRTAAVRVTAVRTPGSDRHRSQ
ncbi:MAG: hypothetical protein WBF89_08195 [Steroidobacteraceae bacterium]|jgi:hypothetical protein